MFIEIFLVIGEVASLGVSGHMSRTLVTTER